MMSMRDWNLKIGDPLALTLAADARLCNPDFVNDQIWELGLGGGEPPTLNVHTTFGLRTMAMRLFPRFIYDSIVYSDPVEFLRPPTVRRFTPDYILLDFMPFKNLDVFCEYWVPDSQAITGRIRLKNIGTGTISLRFEWASILQPLGNGSTLSPQQIDMVNILQGQTGNLFPVLIMTGSPSIETSPYSAMIKEIDITSGNMLQFIWSMASLSDTRESFLHASQIIMSDWEARIAHLLRENERYVLEIETGDPNWDAAFALSQKTAFSLFFQSNTNLPNPSFIQSRQPDLGYSRRGDGSDYNQTWNGQPPLESIYLANLILPGGLHLAEGILRNYLACQNDDATIDIRPNLSGKKIGIPATPLLANLAWNIYKVNQDTKFLVDVYPSLLRYLMAWYEPAHDRDRDGFPEWDHPIQTGMEENPTFDLWHSWGKGYDITTFENPGLAAMLYKELMVLGQMAELINEPRQIIDNIATRAKQLCEWVETTWDPHRCIYLDRDRDSHLSPAEELLIEQKAPGEYLIQKQFKQPRRLQIDIKLQGEATRTAQIILTGRAQKGQIEEKITARSLAWVQGRACFTTKETYIHIEQIRITGLDEQDQITISVVGFTGISLLNTLPLWAGIPDKRRARSLVQKTLLSPRQFFLPHGLSIYPRSVKDPITSTDDIVSLPWNLLMMEGMLSYGFIDETARLFEACMSTIIGLLISKRGFSSLYNGRSEESLGYPHALTGLAPIGLFIEILGIQILSPTLVIVRGSNPFPWPVKIRYRGLNILRDHHHTHITFPDGQKSSVNGPGPFRISLN
jgi:hypothetical protein